jgi:hypothetical protein
MATVGRPFPKGVSGNPGGRPKSLSRKTRELVGGDGEPLIRLAFDRDGRAAEDD